ncbi:hypothetical protein U2066_15305, partial [Listeria monocytogenes]
DAPKYAEDFLAWELMSNWPQALEESHRLNAAQMEIGQTDEEPATFFWYPRPRTQAQTDLNNLPLSLYLLNLGMTSMNSGL